MPSSSTQDPNTYGTGERVVDAGFVVAGATVLPCAIAPRGLSGPEDTADPLRASR